MVASPMNSLTVPSSRPAEDRLEMRMENEPDTPMHHAHRGIFTGSSRYKLIRWARTVMVFLLVVLTVTWLFVDIEDLNIRGRQRGRGRAMNELPEHLPTVAELDSEIASMFSRESDLTRIQIEIASDSQSEFNARDKWIKRLDPIPVQPLDWHPPRVNRSTPIVLLAPRCCEIEIMTEEELRNCNQMILQSCPADAEPKCFEDALLNSACGSYRFGQPCHQSAYMASLVRSRKYLEELEWTNFRIHYSPFSNADVGTQQTQITEDALQKARIIIADAQDIPSALSSYKEALFIAIDGSDSATLPVSLSGIAKNDRVVAVWKAQVLGDNAAQNGPFLDGANHLARLFITTGAGGLDFVPEFHSRSPSLTEAEISKLHPMLSFASRYRYPLDCGGNQDHLRFIGAFTQNFSHWQPPRFAQRTIDVAFVSRNISGVQDANSSLESPYLLAHRLELATALDKLKDTSSMQVLVRRTHFDSYSEYLKQLQQIKILVVPAGMGEIEELDLEAVLCGCLLLKVDLESFQAYPNIFQDEDRMLSTSANWQELVSMVTTTLQDEEHAQRRADRAFHSLLELSDMRRYAADLDEELSSLVRALSHSLRLQGMPRSR